MSVWQRLRAELNPLIWLVYLFFPVCDLIGRPFSEAVYGYAALILFVYFYRKSYQDWAIRFRYLFLQCVIIAAFTWLYGAEYFSLFIYPVSLSGNDPRPRTSYYVYATVFFAVAVLYSFGRIPHDVNFFLSSVPTILMLLLMPVVVRSLSQYIRVANELEAANKKIQALVKQEERQRIARDLHDTLGQLLSMMALKSELAGKLIDRDPERAKREIADVHQTARAALKDVRHIVSSMKTTSWDDEIRSAREILDVAGIVCRYERTGLPRWSPLKESILSYILRELVHNIVKHSRAKTCSITIHHEPETIFLIVEDDGIGFSETSSGGSGIIGMRERLAMVDGALVYEPTSRGTRAVITVPVTAAQAGRRSE